MPVVKNEHWQMLVIDFIRKQFQFYDSLCHTCHSRSMFESVVQKLIAFMLRQGNDVFDVSEWDSVLMSDIPKQLNDYDCGIYLLKYVDELVSDNNVVDWTISSTHMLKYRMEYAEAIYSWTQTKENSKVQ